MHTNNQNPQPKIVLKPILKLKVKETPTDTEIKQPSEPIKRKSNTNKTKIKLKQVSIDICSDMDSVDDASCSSSSSSSSTISTILTASELTTYIVPVYGINMRMSFDNKFIYDMEFNHVGTVTDSKSIDWIDRLI